MPVLGADHQVGQAISVPVDDGRARRVARQSPRGYGSAIHEAALLANLPFISEEIDIDAVHQQIGPAVAPPPGRSRA